MERKDGRKGLRMDGERELMEVEGDGWEAKRIDVEDYCGLGEGPGIIIPEDEATRLDQIFDLCFWNPRTTDTKRIRTVHGSISRVLMIPESDGQGAAP